MIAFVFFSLKRAWQGFWRNAVMSLAATATMVLMLVLLSGLLDHPDGPHRRPAVRRAEGRNRRRPPAVRLRRQVDRARGQIARSPKVASVTYVTADQALAQFRARLAEPRTGRT